MHWIDRRWMGTAVLALGLLPRAAYAQADEIQVYDGGLAARGTFNLTLHNNYTLSGATDPAFKNAVISNHAWVGVAEWAYGVSDWFEAGLYLPLYSHDEAHGMALNGLKLRTLFAVPHADDRNFFYGVNFEFSYNADQWDPKNFTAEIRPIVGWHLSPIDIVINPIFDTAWDGVDKLEFVPSSRVAWNVSPGFAVALEEYADFGTVDGFAPRGDQSHQLFGVIDFKAFTVDVDFGVGFGLTDGSDGSTLKLILSRDLNQRIP